MPLTTDTKAAIVGLGRIASLLEEDPLREKPCTHAGAINACPGLTLCAGADINEERRTLFTQKWKVPIYADAEAMLLKEQPNILCIATHPDSHLFYCELAHRHGVKVAVCEKPLADRLSKAKKIAALHESGKLTVITNHERRYAADYALAKDSITRGERLGTLLGVKAKLYMGKTRRLIDVLWHDGTHLADAAMFLTGAALKHRKTFVDNASGSLKESNGTAYLLGRLDKPCVSAVTPLPFFMELGAGRDHLAFELEFSCERGKLVIGNGLFEIWESKESPYAQGFKSLYKCHEGFLEPTNYFLNMIKDAHKCAEQWQSFPNGQARPQPVSSASDGLRVIRYLRSIASW